VCVCVCVSEREREKARGREACEAAVAMRFEELEIQCVAVCCSVLQCFAVC